MQPDVAIYGRDGQLVAVVEVKRRSGTDSQWAREFRRNLHASGGLPRAPFFLFVTPEWIYLWARSGDPSADPTFEIDARPLLAPYYPRGHASPGSISAEAFEFVVANWLSALTHGPSPAENGPVGDSWLLESGFLAGIQQGRLSLPTAA